MKNFRKHLFAFFWCILTLFLVIVALQYRSRTEALTAIVESQETAISYQNSVIVDRLYVKPGAEVHRGDTLIVVSQPSLDLDIERKHHELARITAELDAAGSDYRSKVDLLTIEKESKINRLTEEKNQLETKINQQRVLQHKIGNNRSSIDSLRLAELGALKSEIADLNKYYRKELERKRFFYEKEVSTAEKALDITEKELDVLLIQRHELVRVADFDGIIASAEVQLHELIPPYQKLLSIYELKPSTIKAYQDEHFQIIVRPGDKVKVVSENRLYSIEGTVMELGARITSYPSKIQPVNSRSVVYGQEIFISIPQNNQFLNGERVFVYPKQI